MNPPLPKKHRGGSPTNMKKETKEEKTSFGEGLLVAVVAILLAIGLFTIFDKAFDFVFWATKLEDRISCLEKPNILCSNDDYRNYYNFRI